MTLKMIMWSFIQCILTFVLFSIYVASSNYSGGEVGMTPLSVTLASLIQLAIIICFSYFVRNYFAGNRLIFLFIINMIVYQLAFMFFSGDPPITGIFERGLIGFLNIGYSLSSLISGLIIIVSYWFISKARIKYT